MKTAGTVKLLAALTVGTLILVLVGLLLTGLYVGWRPFAKLHDIKTAKLPGNADAYGLDKVRPLDGSPMAGKRIVFLGSSVTYGAASQGVSFVDYIGVNNCCEVVKDAVSGTTLVDSGVGSYVSRLKEMDAETPVDLFVCQLSTNDATQKKPLGAVTDSTYPASFDTSTVAGAIEYIIAYVRDTWGCPAVFFTNPQYESDEYAAMVDLLSDIQEKWDITVIDMWSDEAFNAITNDQRSLYMADRIHPTKAGYQEWWTPYMEKRLCEVISNV